MHVGKIYVSFCPFIDKEHHTIKYKSRPILILKEPIRPDTEYIVLPVASISDRRFLNRDYDVKLQKSLFTSLSLNKDSYVRTHKQTTMYRSNIDFTKYIGDVKGDYPDTFDEILSKLDKFNQEIINNAKMLEY